MGELKIEEVVNGYINDLKKKWNMSERVEHKRRVLEYHEPHNLTRELTQLYNLKPEQAKCFDTEFRKVYNSCRQEYTKEIERVNAQKYVNAEEKIPGYLPAIQAPVMAGYENTF